MELQENRNCQRGRSGQSRGLTIQQGSLDGREEDAAQTPNGAKDVSTFHARPSVPGTVPERQRGCRRHQGSGGPEQLGTEGRTHLRVTRQGELVSTEHELHDRGREGSQSERDRIAPDSGQKATAAVRAFDGVELH